MCDGMGSTTSPRSRLLLLWWLLWLLLLLPTTSCATAVVVWPASLGRCYTRQLVFHVGAGHGGGLRCTCRVVTALDVPRVIITA
jgi:hypothetical protein